jgi:hypothetical protein
MHKKTRLTLEKMEALAPGSMHSWTKKDVNCFAQMLPENAELALIEDLKIRSSKCFGNKSTFDYTEQVIAHVNYMGRPHIMRLYDKGKPVNFRNLIKENLQAATLSEKATEKLS